MQDVVTGRRPVLAEQRTRREQHAGRAEAALHGAGVQKGSLERVERLTVSQALDGQDRAPVGFHREIGAGTHGEPVDQHRAGAAHLGVARALGALEVEDVTQHVEQERVRRHLEVLGTTVDGQPNSHATTACGKRAAGSAPRALAAAIRSARRTNTATISRL